MVDVHFAGVVSMSRGRRISKTNREICSVNGRVYTKGEMLEKIEKAGRGRVEEKYIGVDKHTPKKKTQIVDKHGRPQKLTSYQKNKIYERARELKAELKEKMLTHNECWNDSDHNVKNMVRREFPLKDKIAEYKRCMKAIGADPNDIDTEKIRRK